MQIYHTDGKSEEALEDRLMRVKEVSANSGLKLINKTKIMAIGAETPRQINGDEKEVVTDFIYLGSQISSDSDCSHVIKRRQAITDLNSIFRCTEVTLIQNM